MQGILREKQNNGNTQILHSIVAGKLIVAMGV